MDKKISFEDAMTRLDESIRRLESGALSLDDSITVFEEAVSLISVCNERIKNAEGRVRILTEGPDGSLTDAPFDALKDEN